MLNGGNTVDTLGKVMTVTRVRHEAPETRRGLGPRPAIDGLAHNLGMLLSLDSSFAVSTFITLCPGRCGQLFIFCSAWPRCLPHTFSLQPSSSISSSTLTPIATQPLSSFVCLTPIVIVSERQFGYFLSTFLRS